MQMRFTSRVLEKSRFSLLLGIRCRIDDLIALRDRDTRKFLCRVLEFSCRRKDSMSQRLLASWPTGC